jgi:hypothetical protein
MEKEVTCGRKAKACGGVKAGMEERRKEGQREGKKNRKRI